MAELEASLRDAGRCCGEVYVSSKYIFEYLFYLVMIAYQCYDCFSDCLNVFIDHEGYSSYAWDVSWRVDRVYDAFLSSFIVGCICALISVIGYGLLIIGLCKKQLNHQRNRNNTSIIFGRRIVFFSLFCQVSFEETIQCFFMYYYIVPCSIVFDFWKLSLFICSTLNLIIAGYTFFKAVYIWFKKQDSLPRKYNLKVSHVGCFAWCLFASLLTLGLFVLNIVTLANMIKHSTVDVPYVIAENKVENSSRIKITPVKNLVISSD